MSTCSQVVNLLLYCFSDVILLIGIKIKATSMNVCMYVVNSQENSNYANLLNTQHLSQVNDTPRFKRYL